MVNIKESSFSRSTKFNYNWFPKNKSSPVINIKWKGNVICIFGLWSNGNWISILSHQTPDCARFWRFLVIVEAFIKLWASQGIDKVIVTIDNASIHSSKKTNRAIAELELRVELLPPYSTNLAPVELVFSIIKNLIVKNNYLKELNFSQTSCRNAVIKVLKFINSLNARSILSLFIKEANEIIKKAKEDAWLSTWLTLNRSQMNWLALKRTGRSKTFILT